MEKYPKTGIGQDSHRIAEGDAKPLLLGGFLMPGNFHFEGNSDSDVVLHAITNAISGITGKPILGPPADSMCKLGITDSSAYLKKALEDLSALGYVVGHVSISIEGRRPKIYHHNRNICSSVANIMKLDPSQVALTATTGEGLNAFGRGEALQAFCVVSANPR